MDFSVFTAEDLVTATNSEIEILITNELRFTKGLKKFKLYIIRVCINIMYNSDVLCIEL